MKLTSKIRFCVAALAACVSLNATASTAATVTYGNIAIDTADNFMTDINTGRRYARSVAAGETYAATLAAIGTGGAFEGWSIADADAADSFIAALLGSATSPCDGSVAYGTTCGTVSGAFSLSDLGPAYSTGVGYFGYLASSNVSQDSGLIEIGASGSVRDYEDWWVLTGVDSYTNIGYLVYSDDALDAVPVPASLPLILAGMAGLGILGRRKNSN